MAKTTADISEIVAKHDLSPKNTRKLLKRYRIEDGSKFRLKDYDPADTGGHIFGKDEAAAILSFGVGQLTEHQEKLYAQDSWALLCLFQAMDAAGKDGTIKHVTSGVNPQGVDVTSFKAPGPDALDHDFFWRANQALPARGKIGIFNRSYYEEVLVVRVHPELLQKQTLPPSRITKHIWKERFEAIAAYEKYLDQQGTVVLKFFLHLSKEEQKRRFLSRLDHPEKNWKFSSADLAERTHWDDYQNAYEDMIRNTATPNTPWYVVPADHKWFSRLVVVAAMNEKLHSLDLHYPVVDPAEKARLAEARTKLDDE
jgi:PPK2 family polyphosphate:nucleotide phosphotransferase